MHLQWSDSETLADQLAAMPSAADEAWMILVAAPHLAELSSLVTALAARGLRFFGAVFPGLVVDGRRADTGVVVRRTRQIGRPCVVDLAEGVRWHTPPPSRDDLVPGASCAHVFVDFQALRITALLDDLYERYAERLQCFGAGAGTGRRTPADVVFTEAGVFREAAVVAFVVEPSTLTVRHGWRRLDGPFVATRTRGPIIQELDWEPAYELYRRVLHEVLPPTAASAHTLGEARRYPLGIAREGAEDVVRDPLVLDGRSGALTCLSDVPQHSVLHVLHGEATALIEAVATAVADLAAACEDRPVDSLLVFHCMSREQALGDRFQEEFLHLRNCVRDAFGDCPIEGVMALGEIGADGLRRPEFHNKSVALRLVHA